MTISIDDNAGFCFGVVKAIGTAEEELSHGGTLHCLGDIVHNNAEVSRLRAKGLQITDHSGLAALQGQKVLIRAHGEPPETYEQARRLGIRLINATCPIVLALQQRVRKGYEEMRALDPPGQVVIFGRPGHAEVIGLCGQTDNTAVVVPGVRADNLVDYTRPIRLYSQTTKSREEYHQLVENIRAATAAVGMTDFIEYDTICNRVANRAVQLEAFAQSVDMVLFVSGKGSSNGHYLYEYCKHVQPRTYLLSDVGELDSRWLEGVERVGITGATSTPRWLMESIAQKLAEVKLETKN
ncbi:MAG: 4-hydroxy-3-methylbut-2-enyl diphosphate reductase [Bacteroidales bacterium]|nr:4-hydroxy-3-methylbut-2-enyl diphosphate reductase [Bacteroidales bacterium]